MTRCLSDLPQELIAHIASFLAPFEKLVLGLKTKAAPSAKAPYEKFIMLRMVNRRETAYKAVHFDFAAGRVVVHHMWPFKVERLPYPQFLACILAYQRRYALRAPWCTVRDGTKKTEVYDKTELEAALKATVNT